MKLINDVNLNNSSDAVYEENVVLDSLKDPSASVSKFAKKNPPKDYTANSSINDYIIKIKRAYSATSWSAVLEEYFPKNAEEIFEVAAELNNLMEVEPELGLIETLALYKLQEEHNGFIKLKSDSELPFSLIAKGGSYYIHLKEKAGKALGKGGYKRAYKAIHLNLSSGHIEPVAHKKIIKSSLTSKNIANVQEAKKEVETQKLFDHPSIVKIYDCIAYGDEGLAIYEELCEGSLHDMLEKKLPFTLEEKITFFQDIASALSHVHKKGYAHNDLKLDNIFFKNKKAKLADFGHCTAFGTMNRSVFLKTMPPEQSDKSHRISSDKTDAYQFGLMLLQVFHPNLPAGHLENSFVFLPAQDLFNDWPVHSEFDCSMQTLINKCLTQKPEERISMEAIESELAKIKA